jgi:signal transduction histidine kinase
VSGFGSACFAVLVIDREASSSGPHKIKEKETPIMGPSWSRVASSFSMDKDIHIPHRRTQMENNVLRTEAVGKEFVRDMTHELRTPLNVIIGLCQCLERDQQTPLNESQRDTIERMERNAHALLESVNHLLDCMRSGKYE